MMMRGIVLAREGEMDRLLMVVWLVGGWRWCGCFVFISMRVMKYFLKQF